jgi:jacalin-like lectin domain-containing protein
MTATTLPRNNPAATDPINGGVQIAEALKAAGFTVLEIAPALVSAEVYPLLTALQLGVILLDPLVFPTLTADMTAAALTAANKFTPEEVAAAVSLLFARPRKLGPVGGGTFYFGPPANFDDLQFATGLGTPIVGVNLRIGDVIDSLQAVYQGGIVAPQHGGSGDPRNVAFVAGDLLAEVSGQFGSWFGSVYILQIAFRTKAGRFYGPFPPNGTSGQPFTFAAGTTEQIVAFFGQTVLAQRSHAPPSTLVNQLGAYTKPY